MQAYRATKLVMYYAGIQSYKACYVLRRHTDYLEESGPAFKFECTRSFALETLR